MRFARALLAGLLNWVVWPGFGVALAGAPVRAFVYAVAYPASFALALVSPWLLLVPLALAIVAAVDAFVTVHRANRSLAWLSGWPWGVLAIPVLGIYLLQAFLLVAFKISASSMLPTLHVGDHVLADKWTKHVERGDLVIFIYPCDEQRDYVKRVIAVAGDTVEVRCNVPYVNGKPLAEERLADATGCSYEDFDEVDRQWMTRPCSRYRETLDGRTYDIFDDPDRPPRDEALKAGTLAHGDSRDFPQVGRLPSCEMTPEAYGHAPSTPGGKLVQTKANAGPCEPQLHYVVPADQVFVLGDSRHNSNDSRVWGGVPIANIKGHARFVWSAGRGGHVGFVH